MLLPVAFCVMTKIEKRLRFRIEVGLQSVLPVISKQLFPDVVHLRKLRISEDIKMSGGVAEIRELKLPCQHIVIRKDF